MTPFSSYCQSQVQIVNYTSDELTVSHSFPTTPSLVSISLLDWLAELKETFYLLVHWFITKRYNLRTARWKRCIEQGLFEGAWSFRALSRHITLPAPPCVHWPGSSPKKDQ